MGSRGVIGSHFALPDERNLLEIDQWIFRWEEECRKEFLTHMGIKYAGVNTQTWDFDAGFFGYSVLFLSVSECWSQIPDSLGYLMISWILVLLACLPF